MAKTPQMYVDSKLFPYGRKANRLQKDLPDEMDEDLHPDEGEGLESVMTVDEDVKKTKTSKAVDLLCGFLSKAGADQESAGKHTLVDEKTAKKRYENDLQRYPTGVGGTGSPDLPDQGLDWHGDATPDDESDDVPPNAFKASKTSEASKAFSAAPRFAEGPVIPPREREFLLRFGYTPDEIEAGEVTVTPRMRSEFNRYITGVVQKSISGLRSFRRDR